MPAGEQNEGQEQEEDRQPLITDRASTYARLRVAKLLDARYYYFGMIIAQRRPATRARGDVASALERGASGCS